MHVTGRSVVFEVYNPYSIIQLSEALQKFEIHIGERTVYSGRVVISSLVTTGIMLVAQATLVDPWTDIDILSILRDKSKLRNNVDRFLADWRAQNVITAEFKVFTADFQGFLSDLSLWLQQVEVAVDHEKKNSVEQVRNELAQEVVVPAKAAMMEFMERLELLAHEKIASELVDVHKAHLRRAVHPFLLSAPFVHRSFTKPLGYAGDYEMINMILSDPVQGERIFSKAINALVLEAYVAQAHRNRIAILTRLLEEETDRAIAQNRRCKVLNIACGPSREVVNFISRCSQADHCDFTLLDFELNALEFAKLEIHHAQQEKHSKIVVSFVQKSIDTLLREALHGATANPIARGNEYDVVYCAGLFDYLTDSVCRRLISMYYQWLAPGGRLMVTNVHEKNPEKYFMEYLLEWNIFHRNETDLDRLITVGGERSIFVDATGVNVFLAITKET